jgi:hypothetical protein
MTVPPDASPSAGASADPPTLYDFDTWHDQDGYHARFRDELPPNTSGEVHAPTPRELVHEATRLRVTIWTRKTRPCATSELRTGDLR